MQQNRSQLSMSSSQRTPWKMIAASFVGLTLVTIIAIVGYVAGYNGVGAFWLDEINEAPEHLVGQWIHRDPNGVRRTIILFGDGTYIAYALPDTRDTEVIGMWVEKSDSITFRPKYRFIEATQAMDGGPGYDKLKVHTNGLEDPAGRRYLRVPITQSSKWKPITISPMTWDAFRLRIGATGRITLEHLPMRRLPD
jgi:hypothetical protein